MSTKLIINRSAVNERRKQLEKAQDYVDKQALKLMTPYVPVAKPKGHNAGALRDSGKIASPGVIVYTDRWAHSNYYNLQHRNFKHGGNPNATALWFETMKKKHGKAILRGAAAIVGGKAK